MLVHPIYCITCREWKKNIWWIFNQSNTVQCEIAVIVAHSRIDAIRHTFRITCRFNHAWLETNINMWWRQFCLSGGPSLWSSSFCLNWSPYSVIVYLNNNILFVIVYILILRNSSTAFIVVLNSNTLYYGLSNNNSRIKCTI